MYKEVYKALYEGENEEVLEKPHNQHLALRILSFDPFNIDISSALDKYFGKIDRIMFTVMLKRLPFRHKEEVPYLPKPAEKEDAQTEFFKRLAKLYKWSIRELEANMPILLLFFENKEWVKEMALKVGMSREQLKKLGIEIAKPKKKVRKNMSLADFMGGS